MTLTATILVLTMIVPTASGSDPAADACPAECCDPHYLYYRRPAQPVPERVGDDLLGTVQEVVGLLLADPSTDWRQVRIDRLRDYLVDLELLMASAEVAERRVDGGVELTITGPERVLDAARRRVPAHADWIAGFRGWRTEISLDPDGGDSGAVRLRIVSDEPGEDDVIRALGFFGFMASGVHQPHRLLAIARGRAPKPPSR